MIRLKCKCRALLGSGRCTHTATFSNRHEAEKAGCMVHDFNAKITYSEASTACPSCFWRLRTPLRRTDTGIMGMANIAAAA